jgi:hypothetical protein
MSHAGLVKLYIEGRYPNLKENYKPLTKDEVAKRKEEKKLSKKKKTSDNNQLNIF